MVPEHVRAYLALTFLPGFGPILARRAVEAFGDPETAAYRAPLHALRELPGLRAEALEKIARTRPRLRRLVDAELEAAAALGLCILAPGSDEYPAALLETPDPPPVLYLRGRLHVGTTRIAIVGSRRATAYGRRVATGLAGGLAERGAEIVSGGARGIDTCAHRGALDGGGVTTIVLGSGFRHPYPAENRELFDRAADRGAVISEFPLDAEPLPENFPRRNRIISGLSAAIVVVEAALKSGSLHTARHALEQGREVLAVPGPVTSEHSEGCHRLIRDGATLVHRVEDVVEQLPPMYRQALRDPPSVPATHPDALPLSEDERAVLALFDDPEPVHVDLLADGAPFGIARLQAALLGLVLRGAVEQLTGGYYLRALRQPARRE